MAKNKSKVWLWILAIAVLGTGGFFGVKYLMTLPAQQTVVSSDGSGECLGLSSVGVIYNDFNFYKSGTDPASHITMYDKNGQEFKLALADDANSGNTVAGKSSYKAVVGTNAGTPKAGYFSEMVSFDAGCSNVDVQTKMKPSNYPTITIVNDDGITKNTDANDEAMSASSTYNPTLVIKAPAEACSARHGAFLIADYDATYVSKITSSDLSDGNTIVLLTHNSPTLNLTEISSMRGTNDQFKVWSYDGELCNGAKIEPQFVVETTSTQPTEDVNIDFYWLAKDIDTDADTYVPLAPAIYDEDNNYIGEANTNATYFTS